MPGDFSRRMAKRAKNLRDNVQARVRDAAVQIDASLVISTPVDTGRARSNWLPSVAGPRIGQVVEPRDPASAVAETASVASTAKPGDAVYITNNVPYVRRLNDGSSAQAPAGFVERAVQRGRLVFARGGYLKGGVR